MHDEIRHRQARRAADDMDVDVDDAGQQPPPALLSALAVPDDPLDEKINGFFGFGADSGAWFAEFCGGSMDMSTRAGVDFLEMLLDGESSSEAAARAGEAAVATMNVSPSLSSSEEDDDPWMDSSNESEDDAADAHWLPSESASKNTSATGSGKKRRLPRQQQQTAAAAGQRKPQQTEPAVVVEGGGGGSKGGYWCRRCAKVETPLWRAGPEGPKTLCNACGLRYKNSLAAMAAPAMTTTTKRLPTAAKPGGRSAKSKNRSGSVSATVVRKKRT